MLTSIRGLSAATLSAGLLFTAAPAFAENVDSTIVNEDGASVSAEDAVEQAAISDGIMAASIALDAPAQPLNAPKLATDPGAAELVERAIAPIDEADASAVAGESGVSFSGNIAFTTEYRFRGVDLSGGEFAVQGGFDLGHSSGFYVGTWASNLDEQTVGYGSTELDIYGGWSGNLTDGLSADVGVIGYLYPDAGPGEFDYVEFYGSLSVAIGPAGLTGGVAYAPEQDSLGNTDNLYLYTDASVAIPKTPVTLNGHVGYTDGFLTFTTDSEAFDWSVGADFAAGPVTVSAAYVGVEGDGVLDPGGVFTDDAFVATISASF